MYLYLKQKVFAITEKFNFYDEGQNVVLTAKGSFFAIPKKFEIIENGAPILQIKRKMFRILPKYEMFDLPSKQSVCTIKRKFAITKSFIITAPHGQYKVNGSLFGYEFDIVAPDGKSVVSVRKKYISWGDAYQIYFDETQITAKIVAGILVTLDNAVHSNKDNRKLGFR